MTYREAFNAVRVLSYDQTFLTRKQSTDRVLRRVCGWRIKKCPEYREILTLVCGPQKPAHGGGRHAALGKPSATIIEIRERAQRERGAA